MSPLNKMAPHLVERDGQKRCSVCSAIFKRDGEISISKAFTAHVRSEHPFKAKPIQSKNA